VRFTKTQASEAGEVQPGSSTVVNVHTTCLKDIEELNFNSTVEAQKKSQAPKATAVEDSTD